MKNNCRMKIVSFDIRKNCGQQFNICGINFKI